MDEQQQQQQQQPRLHVLHPVLQSLFCTVCFNEYILHPAATPPPPQWRSQWLSLRHLELIHNICDGNDRPVSMCKWHLASALSLSIYICLIFAFFFFVCYKCFHVTVSVAMSKNRGNLTEERFEVAPGGSGIGFFFYLFFCVNSQIW